MKVFAWSPDFGSRMQVRMDRLQKITDSVLLQNAAPYTPMQTGALFQSAQRATAIGSGLLVWDAPYAHYLYEGRVMGPNIPLANDGGFFSRAPKHYTGRDLTYSGAPMRGAKWIERMDAERHDRIVKSIQRAYKGG